MDPLFILGFYLSLLSCLGKFSLKKNIYCLYSLFLQKNHIDEMQAIYLLSNPNGTMKLYEFVIIFGCFMLILAQIPSFHSLRHINLLSLILCLAYSAGATAGSIYIGNFSNLLLAI